MLLSQIAIVSERSLDSNDEAHTAEHTRLEKTLNHLRHGGIARNASNGGVT